MATPDGLHGRCCNASYLVRQLMQTEPSAPAPPPPPPPPPFTVWPPPRPFAAPPPRAPAAVPPLSLPSCAPCKGQCQGGGVPREKTRQSLCAEQSLEPVHATHRRVAGRTDIFAAAAACPAATHFSRRSPSFRAATRGSMRHAASTKSRSRLASSFLPFSRSLEFILEKERVQRTQGRERCKSGGG
jgi:hypothetical protein